MRLGLSNALCPELDLYAAIQKSADWGFEGLELSGLYGHVDLGPASPLHSHPDELRRRLADAGQTIVALNSNMTFCHPDRRALQHSRDRVREYLDLAAEIGCACVVVCGGPLVAGVSKARALGQYVEVLRKLALQAGQRGLRLAIENGGALPSSHDLWFMRDAVGLPSLRVCFNVLQAQAAGEPPSLGIPRLAGALEIVHLAVVRVSDRDGATLDGQPGQGMLDVPLVLELLKGIAYRGWVCVHGAPGADSDPAPSEQVLANTARYLRAELDKPVVVLSAYKGDKTAPRFVGGAPPGAGA